MKYKSHSPSEEELRRNHAMTRLYALYSSQYRAIQSKISKAYEDKLEGLIDADFWATQNSKWNEEQASIEAQMTTLRTANSVYVEKGVQLMELARQAHTLFKTMTTDEKREMLNLVLSNPQIENGTLRFHFKKPFSMFVGVTDLENWRGGRDLNPRPSA